MSTDRKQRRLLELDAKGKPTFVYRRAAETNVAATFARIRRQQKDAAAQLAAQEAAQLVNVQQIKRKVA